MSPVPLPLAHLFVEPPSPAPDGQIEFACRLEWPAGSRRIWFRFPRESARSITLRADPFVIATTLFCMEHFSEVKIHGAVSDGLLANLADFQTAYAAFHGQPAYRPVQYTALMSNEPAVRAQSALGICAFSGGVDSCFSVYRHTNLSTLLPKRLLGGALMMHGFDIPLEAPDVFARSASRSKQLTDNAGVKLHLGSTNLRILPVAWEDTFGTAVAASLSFFQPAYAFGLVPSAYNWARTHFDHGSNPLTDPLLSSFTFPIIHDGTSFGRIEKLQALAQWPAARQHLRVCWQGAQLDRNCCRCEKCTRTMLMLKLCGVDECEAFPLPLDVQHVEKLVIKTQGGLDEFRYLIDYARRRGIDAPWVYAAQRAWERNQRNRRLWRQGRSLAKLVPARWRELLRRGGHRWMWQTSAPATPPTPLPPADTPPAEEPPAVAEATVATTH